MTSSSTTAAAPGWTDPQPVSSTAATATTRTRTFMPPTLPSRRDEGVDDRPHPLQELAVAQRSTADRSAARVRDQGHAGGRLVDALGVQAPQPQLGRLRQRDAGEAHVRAGGGDLGEAGLADPDAQAGDLEQRLDR